MATQPDLKAAHNHCRNHRDEVQSSDTCGCFRCLTVFPPRLIKEWVEDGTTALCPTCGADAVLGSANFLITRQFLRQMQQRWLSTTKPG